MNETITRLDYKLLNKMITTTGLIDAIYNSLYNLEILGEKDNAEYNKYLISLYTLLDKERKIYDNPKLDNERCTAITDFLLRCDLFDFNSDIMLQDQNRVIGRIIAKLNNKMLSNSKVFDRLMPYQLFNIIKKLSKQENNSDQKAIEIWNSFERTMQNNFAYFLQESINDDKYRAHKKHLIKAKYNMSFIYDKDNLINHYYTINPAISYPIADLLNIDTKLYDQLKNEYGFNKARYLMLEMSKISNEQCFCISIGSDLIIKQCLLNASLKFLNNEQYEEINQFYQNFIQHNEHNTISNFFIIQALKRNNPEQNVSQKQKKL